MYDKHNKQQG